ncbi:hypothetical protein HMPREF3213_02743 [Heyndrickxia coagulans]|uniref:Uncharacterized protein n=1 Tax=Heyndrickxia coagulans TaxID=1398 RepID=A0A133KJ71_HEYCO|nr:hypothetical protein HMPREF3213_02743 [Heyndrickxia coagulans]
MILADFAIRETAISEKRSFFPASVLQGRYGRFAQVFMLQRKRNGFFGLNHLETGSLLQTCVLARTKL